jgi:tetratricopeptide (TPR) repeat protein
MYPEIDNSAGLDLSPDVIQVLQGIFARYKRIIIIKEFTVGLSGGRVLEVRPIKADGTPELPTVVKLATVSMIQQEWRAYQKHIHNRLPHIASVAARPTIHPASGWGGLRYPLMGSGSQDIIGLRDFCLQPDVGVAHIQSVLERLLRIMDNVWGFHSAVPDFALQPSYDPVLPPNLLVRSGSPAAGTPSVAITPKRLPLRDPQPGEAVSLAGFAVQKVDSARRTVTLRAPAARPDVPAFGVRLSIPPSQPMPEYRSRQIIDPMFGEVIETRASRLHAEVAALGLGIDPAGPYVPLTEQIELPNPLVALPELLGQTRAVNVATIHGDFNLENILIEPLLGDVSLIDFANARQDHILHDLLHLETEIVIHILPEIVYTHRLDPARVLIELGWYLHGALTQPADNHGLPEHPALHKPWVMLRAIRRAARRYLFNSDEPGEYYHGLTLYLLGVLRYRRLNLPAAPRLPKQIAYWSAALAYQWLLHPDPRRPPPAIAPLLERARSLNPSRSQQAAGAAPDDAAAASARYVPGQSVPGAELLAALPVDRLPPGGVLPPGSRMLLERNLRFVGRQEQLKLLAATLKRGEADPAAGVMAIVGMGGVGKTQLACEFAHRFGRFFAGGVFWLSCADPQAIAAEVAACGEIEGMQARAHFRELPLAEQVRLVLAEWQKPIPRLLIFDNCEAPELIERWYPRGSGCRLLLTSRRAGWDATLGIPTLALDVLRRTESTALLREHQPDADRALLGEIAHELGDLPLALHLAGSYLARYRHTTDAAGYLASLRRAPPLRHESLRSGGLLPTEHAPHVARTFAFSYDQLDHDEPAAEQARRLLDYAACLAPGEPIPESLARLALLPQHGDAADAVRAGFQLGVAVNQLIELGLVRAEANRALWLHRLVVAFARERMGDRLAEAQLTVERALLGEAERLNGRREPAELRSWQVHLRFIADAAVPRGDPGAADLAHALAEHLRQTGDYQGAVAYHERALRIRQVVLGDDDPATARSLTQLGNSMLFYGDVGRARPYFEQALAIQQAKLGDHTDTAITLNHLGFLLMRQGELAAAQPCHEQALRIRRTILGDEHPAAVDSLSNLAYIHFQQGNLASSRAMLEQALAMQRKARGDDHPETARVLTHLGDLLQAQGELEEAESVLDEALVIQVQQLGAEHPDTARTLRFLGDVRRQAGDAIRARWYYERALKVFQASHGADHFRTKEVLAQLTALGAGDETAEPPC